MKNPKEWRVSCKKRQIRERITRTPKSVGEIKRIMKKPPKVKILEGV
jgi:hypothetical protein